MSLASRIAQGVPARIPWDELICGAPGCAGAQCQRALHTTETLHRSGELTWGSRDPFVPTWLRLARQRPLGLARDLTGRTVL